jgi:formyltetrahydrofolate deformylase
MSTYLLLIKCPDAKGLVFKITGILFRHGVNVISNHEFVDAENDYFFMRTAFSGEVPETLVDELRAVLPENSDIRLSREGKRAVVIFATKEPHCLGDLLLRHAYDELPATIQAVVANHPDLEPLARQFGIPFHLVSHAGRERAEHEAEILRVLAGYSPEFLVLAKYMRTLTPQFLAHFPSRIINIHHSFLPAFQGARPYQQAFERGVKIIGASAHIVTEELDTGPIIAQGLLPVDHTHTASDMAQAGRDIEKFVLAKALKLVLEERVFLHRNRTIIFE